WLDIAEPGGPPRRIEAASGALAAFARAAARAKAIVVYEASGGYERPLERALARSGVDRVKVNPRHARDFARATGTLAKSDRLDAAVLARMGAALCLEPDPPPDPARQ